ncbi:hypothetical protein GIB67_000867 [Kingdonia uniflora]|uniref:Uncharacterized protein n=1 Tax=Kingdonia uniflora TaxID=39325 RepID=A0A7J7LFQ5_9MAGN|nr:hypothetical protein GIB67_000867 [Kingdonia uniflora]
MDVAKSALSDQLRTGRVSNVKGALWAHRFSSQAELSFAKPDRYSDGNLQTAAVWNDFAIFKGKGALLVKPLMPQYTKLESGHLRTERKGCMMLSFMPSIGERKYNSEKKQYFALSATEIGALINLGPGKSCEFFHDPSMKSSNAGQVRKSLSVSPLSLTEDNGYFFNLSFGKDDKVAIENGVKEVFKEIFCADVVNNSLKTNERLSVPVTKPEFTVLQTTFSFMLPYLLGWDHAINRPPSTVAPRLSQIHEWEK